jgi:TetR/AcrR family transcriptional regulator, regulator of cefoperazone and chloramphenicol sensitivity
MEARRRLIEAGLDLFSRFSFEGVSTRLLAERAQVNLASIQYYFGSKEGLYLAVAEHIVEQIEPRVHPTLAVIERRLESEQVTPDQCIDMVCEVLDLIISITLSLPETKNWLGIFLREQMEPTAAFDILYERHMKVTTRTLCLLVARALGLKPDDLETGLRTFAIVGQVLMFHLSRATVQRFFHWEVYTPREIEEVQVIIRKHIAAILSDQGRSLP